MSFDPTSLLQTGAGRPQQQQQQQQKFDISQTEPMHCEECGGSTFEAAVVIRRISPLVAPDGQERFAPLQVFACRKCDHVNSVFLPFDQKDED